MSNSVSRREFLHLLGSVAGTSAVLKAGAALGLMPSTAFADIPQLLQLTTNSRRAVILGAGISGLAAAWELTKAGYDCTVLEASHRPGGRIFTVRAGSLIDEIGNFQTCEFDDEPHMYFNAGAARIPSTHATLLHYCQELEVELEVFINENKMAWVQDDNLLGGKPIRNIDFTTNARGFLAEMLSKSLSSQELTEGFTREEMETLLGMLRNFGDLNEDMLYQGSTRAGYASGGFLEHGVARDMIAFRDLLKTPLARNLLSANEGDTGPILMQAVGGNDRIIAGFIRKLGDRVHYRSPVRAVQVKDDGVDVVYEQDGVRRTISADYCLNCIPSHLMTGIENNFPTDYVNALKYIRRGEAYKAAFQAKSRFWEKEDIYGGISWTGAPIQQIWYPSHGIHKRKGVILAAYDYGGGMQFTKMTQPQRIEALLAQGEKIHPDYRNLVEKPITIAWHRMDHMLGCSARFNRDRGGFSREEEAMYHLLQEPVNGRHFMIGDQISQHSAWMESALQSAHYALRQLDARVRAAQA